MKIFLAFSRSRTSTMVEQFGLNLYKFFKISNLLDRLLFLKLEETAIHGQYSGQPLEEQIMNFHEDIRILLHWNF